MPDYQKSKIYKLWSPSNNLVYYGSTVQSLSQRLTEHLCNYNKNKGLSSKIVLECEDYKIELVEDFPCNNRQQLLKKEGEYIKNNECVNKNIAGRTQKEWNETEHRIQYLKKYYEKNKEHINQYYEKNKEDKKEYGKQYRLKQKELVKIPK